MKKSAFLVGIISMVLVPGLCLVGCAGTVNYLGTYGEVPEDQLCTLEIAGGLKVVSFNGTEVSWAENGSGPNEGAGSKSWEAQQKGSKYKTIIKIPAGSHTLGANLYLWDYNAYPGYEIFAGQQAGYIRASGLQIINDFKPGHTYFLRPVLVVRNLFAKEDSEIIDYNNSGPTTTFRDVYLRIDENGAPVAAGKRIDR